VTSEVDGASVVRTSVVCDAGSEVGALVGAGGAVVVVAGGVIVAPPCALSGSPAITAPAATASAPTTTDAIQGRFIVGRHY
jgi:hypothetical protein